MGALDLIQVDPVETPALDSGAGVSLHEYLLQHVRSKNVAGSVFTAMHSGTLIGKSHVDEQDKTLYFYNHDTHYVLSRGGRVITYILKAALFLTKRRTDIIQDRFIHVGQESDEHLLVHFENLHKLAAGILPSDTHIPQSWTVYMPDLRRPFAEVKLTKAGEKLVLPLPFIIDAATLGLTPTKIVEYAGQHIMVFTNAEATVKVLYVAHLLEKSLFTQ
jgi:hypothetical protein